MDNIYEWYAKNVNYYAAPGLPTNRVVIYADGKVYTEEEPEGQPAEKIEEYVNNSLAPWILVNAIYCDGIDHGNFVRNRAYCKLTEIPGKKEDDYDINADILNYAEAVMVAAHEHLQGKKGVTLVEYVGEADICVVQEFADENELRIEFKEWIEAVENDETDTE